MCLCVCVCVHGWMCVCVCGCVCFGLRQFLLCTSQLILRVPRPESGFWDVAPVLVIAEIVPVSWLASVWNLSQH